MTQRERVEVLTLDDKDRWDAAVASVRFPSQSWSYAWGLSASGLAPRLGLVDAAGARLLIPFVEIEGAGFTDIATFQSMSGASVQPAALRPFQLWSDHARSRGWVTGYLQMSPYADFPLEVPSGTVLPRNDAFLVDVDPGAFLDRVSRTIRSKIHAAERQGVQLVVDDESAIDALQRLYPASMTRLQARRSYHHSPETLARWARDQHSLLIGARMGPEIEAVCLIHFGGALAEAPVYACGPGHRHLQAWLVWQALPLLAQRGVRAFNIGGADPNLPGLYAFKERFHAAKRRTVAVCQVYDQERFARLCDQAGQPMDGAFFPPYRMMG
jgi:hypothetical protein